MEFKNIMMGFAHRHNAIISFDGNNIAFIIERGKDGKPSEQTFRTEFRLRDDKVYAFKRGAPVRASGSKDNGIPLSVFATA